MSLFERYGKKFVKSCWRFSISVKQRTTNKKCKALEEGMPKSRADEIGGVDAIADEKKAIEWKRL